MKKYKPGMKSPELPWGSPSLEYRICNQSPCDTPEQKILLYLCCLKQAFAHPMIGRTEGYTDAQLRAVFQHYKHIELYNLLKRYPKSTYLNSHKPSQPPKQNYCLVDIVSIFAILRLSKPRDISVLSNYEIFLTLLFYLKEEQVLDDMFMAYFSPRFQSGKFMNMMLKGNNGEKEQLTLLIIDLMRSVLREIGMKASMQFQREKDILFELYPFYMSQRVVMLRRVQKPVAIAKKFVKDSLQNVQQSIRQQQQQQQKQQQQQLQQQQQQQQQSIRQYRKLPRQLSSIYQYSSRYEDDRASSWEYRVMGLESQLWFQSMIQQQLPDPLEIQQQLPDPPEIPEQIPDAPAIPEQVREPDHRQEVVPNAEMIQEICHGILEERIEQQEAMEDEDMRTPRTQRIKKRKNPGKTKFITLWNLRSPTR